MGRRQGERRQLCQRLSSPLPPDHLTRRYYYAPATLPSDGDKWLLMLEGGEWCYDAPSCAQRAASQPDLLTSHGWYPHKRFSGVFETDEAKNPFHSVAKVYVPYCSSDAWVGDTTAGGLTFAGQRIVAAVLRALATVHGLGQTPGQRLLFGGCSAGARGAMFTLDSVELMLQAWTESRVDVSGLLDSPLWIDVAPLATAPTSLQCEAQSALYYLNASARLGEACLAAYPDQDQHWRCLFGEYRMPLLHTPYALNAAQYDSFQLEYALGGSMPPTHPGQITYADEFGEAMLTVVSALPAADQAGSGVFSSACFKHCVTLSADFWTVQSEGISLSTALRWWFFGGCPQSDCPDGLPTQVIEHCDEGFEQCKHHCTLRHSSKGGKLKPRSSKTFAWQQGWATPPAPYVPIACQNGPPVPVLS